MSKPITIEFTFDELDYLGVALDDFCQRDDDSSPPHRIHGETALDKIDRALNANRDDNPPNLEEKR